MRSLTLNVGKLFFYLLGAVMVCMVYMSVCLASAAFTLLALPFTILGDIFKGIAYLWRKIWR